MVPDWRIYVLIAVVVLLGVYVLYSLRDRELQRDRPIDAVFTGSASLYIGDAVAAMSQGRPDSRRRRLGLLSRLGGSAAVGFVDVLNDGLRWRPGRVSRRQGFSELLFSREEITSIRLWGDRLDGILALEVLPDAQVKFQTRNVSRLREELMSAGFEVMDRTDPR